MRRRLSIFCLGCVSLIAACGPIEYAHTVSFRASHEVDAAKAARADKWAPYWYTRAVEYLRKAHEEASYADFQAANRFGGKAEDAAKKAREQAEKRSEAARKHSNRPVGSTPEGDQ